MSFSFKQRKGAGYMIEGIIAAITIFVFAFGQSPTEPVQDWSTFQDEITANDLSYTLKETGDIENSLKLQHTGSLETAVSSMTGNQLEVSGTIENLPLNDASIGFTATNYGDLKERHTDSIRNVTSTDRCADDLEEIENQSGTSIKRTEDPGSHDGVVLYLADTDPQISGGFTDEEDYDTLYVDNKTRCQFSSSEGPIYTDKFFRWNTSTSGEYEYYDLKNIDGDTEEGGTDATFTYYNATQPNKLQKRMNKPVNSIETSQNMDTFDMATTDISVYDLIIIRRQEAIKSINNSQDQVQNLTEFMRDKPVLILANLSKNNVERSFVNGTGLEWIDLKHNSKPRNPEFGQSPSARKLETYFNGVNGDLSNIDLPIGGNISSSNSESLTQEDPLLYTRNGEYVTNPWNATNDSMKQVDPGLIKGKPESACYEDSPSSDLTRGNFSFPSYDSDLDEEYRVINVQMGKNPEDCEETGGVRALSIDLDKDGVYTEENEGPFLTGEKTIVENRKYSLKATETDSAEFIFTGNDDVEVVNYRTSFKNFNGYRIARIGYEDPYSQDDMKLISSTVYWLLGDTMQFGQEESSSVSTTVLGSINQNVYMPYRLSLRWR